jgi:hypothetical protein
MDVDRAALYLSLRTRRRVALSQRTLDIFEQELRLPGATATMHSAIQFEKQIDVVQGSDRCPACVRADDHISHDAA